MNNELLKEFNIISYNHVLEEFIEHEFFNVKGELISEEDRMAKKRDEMIERLREFSMNLRINKYFNTTRELYK